MAGFRSFSHDLIEWSSIVGDVLAVAVISIGVAWAFGRYASRLRGGKRELSSYTELKVDLGRVLLLGLEVFVAADIIKTASEQPDLSGLLELAILVGVRTFIGWSLVLEIDHRWPWQRVDLAPDARQGG